MASVAHNHGRLALPLVVEVVDGVLDSGRVSPVVLRCDENECVVALDLHAPGTGVSMVVFSVVEDLGRNIGFVVEREIPILKIDDVQRRLDTAGSYDGCRLDGLDDEVCDLGAGARLSGAADDNAYF